MIPVMMTLYSFVVAFVLATGGRSAFRGTLSILLHLSSLVGLAFLGLGIMYLNLLESFRSHFEQQASLSRLIWAAREMSGGEDAPKRE